MATQYVDVELDVALPQRGRFANANRIISDLMIIEYAGPDPRFIFRIAERIEKALQGCHAVAIGSPNSSRCPLVRSRPFPDRHVEVVIVAVFFDQAMEGLVEPGADLGLFARPRIVRQETANSLPKLEKRVQQLLAVAEVMVKPAACDAEPMRKAVDFNASNSLFYQHAASRLNPRVRRHLTGASRHQSSRRALFAYPCHRASPMPSFTPPFNTLLYPSWKDVH